MMTHLWVVGHFAAALRTKVAGKKHAYPFCGS
jgi:hypothetical protein